ncbi:hypothetical protein ANME2D_03042 [Candidatus Methanoperedens nitroreducens]|uniref:Uncharacterized protein n=1 Tax=Candidatus Methanoperedens nitratireducens TaxID=1392998 RepID=A0A062V336_9EURY|nr:hypothetical protein [Candidatus Methanoperedens nitroreducens]KCZ71013.1 hypothetical protein ANME2D_03042 [Candidatus Methanoperedens nitroreducens]MDJ1421617.1 hypothetical protein [Candidatus Methanoperedens sp.]
MRVHKMDARQFIGGRRSQKESLKTIEKVYGALSSDKEIQARIEKIKTHEWVKIIEGV